MCNNKMLYGKRFLQLDLEKESIQILNKNKKLLSTYSINNVKVDDNGNDLRKITLIVRGSLHI